MPEDQAPPPSFVRRVLVVAGIAVTAFLLLSLVWYAGKVFLLIFAGLLLAVFLDGLATFVSHRTPLSRRWALLVVGVGLLLTLAGAGLLIGPSLAEQADELGQTIPEALDSVQSQLEGSGFGRWLLSQAPETANMMQSAKESMSGEGEEAESDAGDSNVEESEEAEGEERRSQGGESGGGKNGLLSAFSKIISGLINLFVILFVGVYAAVSPALYRENFLYLFPGRRRERLREVAGALGHSLRRWLMGQLASMAVVGALSAVGLMILGVPLALALGLIAALFSFVPYLGPILAAAPAILVGMMEGPQTALYVAALYLGVQFVESYLITPLIQKRAVELPPALLIASQVLMGVLAGALGVLLAAPLIVAVIVIIQMLYVEDVLGDDVQLMGHHHDG